MKRRSEIQIPATLRHLLLSAFCLLVVNACFGQQLNNRIQISPRPTTTLSGTAGCTVDHLDITFRTGNDDLRGGGNDLNLEIHFSNGSIQFVKNVNRTARWPNNSVRMVSIPLEHPIPPNQIKTLRLIHLAQGSFRPNVNPNAPEVGLLQGIRSEDNWDMAEMQAAASSANGPKVPIASFGMHRFTGNNPSLDVASFPNVACPVSGQVTQLEFAFQTGNDDLRGGNDNLNVTIIGDGLLQKELNVNRSQRWADGTAHRVTVMLNHPVTIQQIHNILLETTFGGGAGGDNWNMESLQVYAHVNGSVQSIATQGFFRFTGPPGNRLMVATK
jgi:hypothetical protein